LLNRMGRPLRRCDRRRLKYGSDCSTEWQPSWDR
jgi:hypothetical protein